MQFFWTSISYLVDYTLGISSCILLYGHLALMKRAIKRTKRDVQIFPARAFSRTVSRNTPIITIAMFLILLMFSPCVFSDFEGRKHLIQNYGTQIDRPITYITHAFIHADLTHFMLNSLLLLSYGVIAEFHLGKKWLLTAIALTIPLGIVATIFYMLVFGEAPEKPSVGSSAILFALLIISISGIVRFWDREHRKNNNSGTLISIVVAIIATLIIFAVDTKGMTTWTVSEIGHSLGLIAGLLIVSTRAIRGNTEITEESQVHLNRLEFLYMRCWERLRKVTIAALVAIKHIITRYKG